MPGTGSASGVRRPAGGTSTGRALYWALVGPAGALCGFLWGFVLATYLASKAMRMVRQVLIYLAESCVHQIWAITNWLRRLRGKRPRQPLPSRDGIARTGAGR